LIRSRPTATATIRARADGFSELVGADIALLSDKYYWRRLGYAALFFAACVLVVVLLVVVGLFH
jgi:hypothetical protein